MIPAQENLLIQAQDSLRGAKLLSEGGLYGFAASRAYYTMFYIAEAFLIGKGLSFSKHSAVHAAFGRHFARTEIVPFEFHQQLLEAMEMRHAGDYEGPRTVTREEAAEQIARAEKFIELAERLIGPIPVADPKNS
jgi:uncharacterized protein (UPF0332 family)